MAALAAVGSVSHHVPDQGSYAFRRTQPDGARPVGFDPCRPIGYVVHDEAAPAGALPLLQEAMQEVSVASGLTFRYLDPGKLRRGGVYRAGGSDREPVFVGWTTPENYPPLTGGVVGTGGGEGLVVNDEGDLEYEHGRVILDAPQLTRILASPGGEGLVRAVMMHELGHVLGLGHVDDSGELMHHDNVGQLEFGPGDRDGLAALGAGRCEEP